MRLRRMCLLVLIAALVSVSFTAQTSGQNKARRVTKPQVRPMPNPAGPQGQNVPPQPGPGPYVPYTSNACYVTVNPASGCYLSQSALPGTQCYCVDAYGNPHYGAIY
jgi:hypothetical protein